MLEFIIKRDGKMTKFEKSKIVQAIIPAMREAGIVDNEFAVEIADSIAKRDESCLGVESIQDKVEEALMTRYPDTARRYIKYRAERTRKRNMHTDLMKHIKEKVMCTNEQCSNANVDEKSFGAKKNEAAGVMMKEIAVAEMLDPDVLNAWLRDELYIHDFTEYPIGSHNCLNADIRHLLNHGFMTRNGGVRHAGSFSTACQLVAVIFQANSQDQYGGIGSTHIDRDLAPFARTTFLKSFKTGLLFAQHNKKKTFEDFCSKYDEDVRLNASIIAKANIFKDYSKAAYDYAIFMTEREGRQSAEGLYHNLNTLESRPGSQLPFSSLNFGLDTSYEGRCVSRWLMEASMGGIGQYHLTPIFPISIFVHKKDINDRKGTPNYDLFQMAIKSLAERIYPNIANADWSTNKPDVHPTHYRDSADGNYSIGENSILEVTIHRKGKITKKIMTAQELFDYASSKAKVQLFNDKDPDLSEKYVDTRFLEDEEIFVGDKDSMYKDYNLALDERIAKVNYISSVANERGKCRYAITTDTLHYDVAAAGRSKVKRMGSFFASYTYDYDTEMATMGCRTLIGYDIFGMGYKKSGRGNISPATMNLTKLGIDYGICLGKRKKADLHGFWKAFEELLKITEKSLIDRFEYICSQSPKSAYFMYDNGTIADSEAAKKNDKVYEAMKHGTLAFGFVGISNMLYAMFGEYHNNSKAAMDFGLKVIKRISEYADEAKERHHLNFSVYATPAEGSCFTICKQLQKRYGKIKGVTDRAYINNSFHVPVYEKVSIKEKIDIESKFTGYCTGGTITYVELDSSVMHNMKAIEDIIEYAMNKDIPYFAVNHDIDNCLTCGFSGEIGDACPKCGGKRIQRLRRVTGYLTADYKTRFNLGKRAEVDDRVKHSMVKKFDK